MENNFILKRKIDPSDIKDTALSKLGLEMYQLISELYPICRSITGNGVRETLNIIKQYIWLVQNLSCASEQVGRILASSSRLR
jgi:aminopeptidase-like protein